MFPYLQAPEAGAWREVAPGIIWFRLRLPYGLDHVNAWLIEDDGGWALFDCGLSNDETRAFWDGIFAGPLAGRNVTRVIASHFHPDHVGLAGWLCERFAAPLLMPRTEFMMTRLLENTLGFAGNPQFYAEHGLPAEASDALSGKAGQGYLRRVYTLPAHYTRLKDGDTLRIGGRDFLVMTGGGHALEQAVLWCEAEKLFLSADQVLARISPNVSVMAIEPKADPLAEYLRSLRRIGGLVAEDVLVLPGHHVPFYGLQARLEDLQLHHAHRCGLIAEAAARAPMTTAELIPVMFKRALDTHQTGFAFGEALAHVNYMIGRGELLQERAKDGVLRVRAA